MSDQRRQWTWIPPALTGRQVEGTSLLPFGRYEMPDGTEQVSFGLPNAMLDAFRTMRYLHGDEQDPNAPPGFISEEAVRRGGMGLAESAAVGSLAARAPRNALRSGLPKPEDMPAALDPSQAARLARAREMGFDIDNTWYHATTRSFDEFRSDVDRRTDEGWYGTGHYFESTPERAEAYISDYGDFADDAQVGAYLLRGRFFDLPHTRRVAEFMDWMPALDRLGLLDEKSQAGIRAAQQHTDPADQMRAFVEAGGAADRSSGFPMPMYKQDYIGRFIGPERMTEAAQAAGFDGMRIGSEVVVFDPSNIRSVNAMFDPSQSDSANLLAANAKPGSGVGAAMSSARNQADPQAMPAALDPSSAARLARAREMGFDIDTTWYRGRGNASDPNEFRLNRQGHRFDADQSREGIFGSDEPRVANAYAEAHSQRATPEQSFFGRLFSRHEAPVANEGANVVPFFARGKQKIIDVEHGEQGIMTNIAQELQQARADGYDYAILRGNPDALATRPDGSFADEVVVFDPRNIRSVNAMFDPAKSDSANLLAANPMAGAVPLTFNMPEAPQDPRFGDGYGEGRRLSPQEVAQRNALIAYLEGVR